MPILLICLYFLYAYTSEKTTLHFRTLLLYNNPKTHICKEGLFQILKGLISEYVQYNANKLEQILMLPCAVCSTMIISIRTSSFYDHQHQNRQR